MATNRNRRRRELTEAFSAITLPDKNAVPSKDSQTFSFISFRCCVLGVSQVRAYDNTPIVTEVAHGEDEKTDPVKDRLSITPCGAALFPFLAAEPDRPLPEMLMPSSASASHS